MRKLYSYGLSFMLVLAVTLGGWLLSRHTSARTSIPAAAVQHETSPIVASSTRTVDSAGLETKLANIMARYPAIDIGVSITDLGTGTSYNYGDSLPYVAASTNKLLTAMLYLHQVEAGRAALSDKVGDGTASSQLQRMVVNSDNQSWQYLNELLTHNALQAYARSLGITSYNPDDNTITSRDMALLLSKFYKHQLLNTANTQLLLSYMSQANGAQYIPATIPAGAKVYHKAGWLDDRVHDAAIVDDGRHAYVLVIFSKVTGVYDTSQATTLFHAITQTTDETFLATN